MGKDLFLFRIEAQFYERYTWQKPGDDKEYACSDSCKFPLNVVAGDVEEAVSKYKEFAMRHPVRYTDRDHHNGGGDPIYPTRVVVKKAELLLEVHVQ